MAFGFDLSSDDPVAVGLRTSARQLLGVAAFSGVVNLLTLSGSLYMLQVYDRVIPSRSVATLVGLSLIVLLAYVLQGYFDALRTRMLTRIGALFDAGLQEPIYLALATLPLIFVLSIICTNAMALTSWTPTGALSKITQFTVGAIDRTNPASNLTTAGMTAEIAANAANLLSDIKPGYMLGAKPRQQAMGHVIGIFSGALAAVPLFFILFFPPDGNNTISTAAGTAACGGLEIDGVVVISSSLKQVRCHHHQTRRGGRSSLHHASSNACDTHRNSVTGIPRTAVVMQGRLRSAHSRSRDTRSQDGRGPLPSDPTPGRTPRCGRRFRGRASPAWRLPWPTPATSDHHRG